jgi:hydrogenase maturation protease
MIHVICFGNLWQGDDGFGVRVFQRLCDRSDWPDHVKMFEAGTAGLAALDYFEGCRKVVIVDALKTGGAPGRVCRLAPDEIDLPDEAYSLHQLGVNHLLAAMKAAFAGRDTPEVVVIGAEVGEIDPFTDRLSPALEAALELVVDLIIHEVERNLASTMSPRR